MCRNACSCPCRRPHLEAALVLVLAALCFLIAVLAVLPIVLCSLDVFHVASGFQRGRFAALLQDLLLILILLVATKFVHVLLEVLPLSLAPTPDSALLVAKAVLLSLAIEIILQGLFGRVNGAAPSLHAGSAPNQCHHLAHHYNMYPGVQGDRLRRAAHHSPVRAAAQRSFCFSSS